MEPLLHPQLARGSVALSTAHCTSSKALDICREPDLQWLSILLISVTITFPDNLR